MTPRLLLKWSLRDLRTRWIQVVTIALVIGLGIGSFASFNSMTAWRLESNAASFEATRMYDLRVDLSDNSFVPQGDLSEIIAAIPSASGIEGIEERLSLPTQIKVDIERETETGTESETVLVPGLVVGMDFADPDGISVNRVHLTEGRELGPTDSGEMTVLLEHKFAVAHGLPPNGEARIAGGREIRYVGHALAPEYFIVLTEGGGFFAHASYAIIFASLETVQTIAARPGMVDEAIIRVSDDMPRETVIADLERAMGAALPLVGFDVTQDTDDPVFRTVNEDVEGDQQTTNIIAFAMFIGAVFAAFNLTSRMVETQRREIGIAMALGVPGWRIALRPLVAGGQIALGGIIFGVIVGWVLAQLLKSVLNDFLPLPVWVAPFQYQVFITVTVVGLLVLSFAIGYPVWRAVRVNPIDAIKTGHLAARGGGLTPLVTRLPVPGATFAQLPFRNVARAPRRALLTIMGIAAAVAVTVVLVGVLDSYLQTLRDGRDELLRAAPERLQIDLALPVPADSSIVATISEAETIDRVEPEFRMGASLSAPGADEEFDVLVRFIDFDSDIWTPTAVRGSLTAQTGGVVLAEKAAADLGVDVGDDIVLTHPVREGMTSFSFQDSILPVIAIHPHYLRFNVYMDNSHMSVTNITNFANRITALAAPGVEILDVKEELFPISGVVSVQTVAEEANATEELLNQFITVTRLMQMVPLLLAILIAYNTAGIAMDERRREHATMAAFGVPYRTVMRMAMVESGILGAMATVLGAILGFGLLLYITEILLPRTSPELGLTITFSAVSVLAVVLLGVVAVGLAPLLTTRRLRRADIPSTLRVME